jgi:putative Holliday junction resolvase
MGLALGDDATGIASPLEVVAYPGVARAAALIVERCRRHGAGCVVIGLPTNADGETTPACRRSEALAEAVAALGLPVELQGEYLSSREARQRAREVGLGRERPVDHIAAQVLLEEFLAR